MEKYLCKAKLINSGKWAKGWLVPLGKKSSSDPDRYGMIRKAIPVGSQNIPLIYKMFIVEIDPQTVCWCVGLPDKNGNDVFGGDLIKTSEGIIKIIWNAGPNPYDNKIDAGFGVVFVDAKSNDLYRHDVGYWLNRGELVGNIFDNPELSEGGEGH